MRRLADPLKPLTLLLPLALLAAGGCGPPSAESLLKSSIAAMHEMADAIESGASQEEMQRIADKMKRIKQQMGEVEMSAEEAKRLKEKYQSEMIEAVARMGKAAASRVGSGLPGMPSFLPSGP